MRVTLNIEDSIAKDFQMLIPSGDRSAFVGELLATEIARRKKAIIEACQKANADSAVEAVVNEWQSFDEKVEGREW